ncbi:MAG: hypothetical protein JW751_02830 [Polyangiaceae bacterium]|nr:hypothetical protein [Polyangiaceae bacterium]
MARPSLAHGRRASFVRRVSFASPAALALGALATACLDRPVAAVEPETTNLFVQRAPNDQVDKIDLLLMIDNSISMADKQVMLGEAVPILMRRLVEPLCTDGVERVLPLAGGGCAEGFKREFEPVRDIHVGVISSSLGGFGSNQCAPAEVPARDDAAHFVATRREGLTSYQGLGFLVWDPGSKRVPPGESDPEQLANRLRDIVVATADTGCGFEASLEAWYRFLVEPDPATGMRVENERLVFAAETDTVLLDQRRAFLRPDSLVAVVMLSDENDCSVAVGGSGHRVGSSLPMPRGTAACEAAGPNDPCCRPCMAENAPPSGCVPIDQDPVCSVSMSHDSTSDAVGVRCFDQKRRFGVDLLYPVQRYIDGLTRTEVVDRHGQLAANPLFVDPNEPTALPRSPNLVFLAGIVGLPWQDAATPETLAAVGLEYLSSAELAASGRWDVLLGDRAAGIPPTDPFMIEAIDARPAAATNPITGAAIGAPDTGVFNAINGHDYFLSRRDDLQYACIYPLADPVECAGDSTCPCENGEHRAVCRNPTTGEYGTQQFFARAYPGVRQLEVLKGVKEQAIVASICPKVLDPDDPAYGYSPAVQALIDRLGSALRGACLPRALDVEPELGTVPCRIVEALPPVAGTDPAAACALPGRGVADDALRKSVARELRDAGSCDAPHFPACAEMVMCTILPAQIEGPAALASCQNDDPPAANGFCYIDAHAGIGNADLVASCPATSQRMVRLVTSSPDHNPIPRKGATVFYACRGGTVSDGSAP